MSAAARLLAERTRSLRPGDFIAKHPYRFQLASHPGRYVYHSDPIRWEIETRFHPLAIHSAERWNGRKWVTAE